MARISPERLRALIAEELPRAISTRRDLHMHPEIAYEEHRTAEVIRRALQEAGIEFRGGLAGGTGTLAHLPGRGGHRATGHRATGHRATGLRADIDALP
ncbi:MAG: hypothetical protein SGJ11_18295, partial [Phycisphaerae bacterium]|nr:hypothetical protein [Phycisphaerae bacterium]